MSAVDTAEKNAQNGDSFASDEHSGGRVMQRTLCWVQTTGIAPL